MRKQGIGLLCAAALLMTGCRAPRRPTETVWLESDEKLSAALPGLRRLADGDRLLPILWQGRLLYQHDTYPGGSMPMHRLLLDRRGEFVSELPLPDTAGLGSWRHDFAGAVDPAGRLIYVDDAFRPEPQGTILLYDVPSGRLRAQVELVDLHAAARAVTERWYRDPIDRDLRRRLARAGCLLPEPPTPPKPDFEVIGTAFPRPGGENTLRILARAARRMNAENREEKHYRQVLTRYYAEVLPTFDAVIERFVADHAAGAFLLTTRGVEGVPVEFTVLPERGFAFARTPGMATRALPRPIPATVEPPAGGAHPEVVLRHTGRRSWMQFTPIAYIPWWTWRTMHYYSLAVGGRTGAVWSFERLRVLDVHIAEGRVHFSLIDPDGMARLYVCE